jgi:hypothetical protein
VVRERAKLDLGQLEAETPLGVESRGTFQGGKMSGPE